MPSRILTAVWAALDFGLMVSGIVCIAFSFIWRAPNLVRDLTISHLDLNGRSTPHSMRRTTFLYYGTNLTCSGGLILGIMLEIAFVISLFAITQPKPLTSGFRLFNWVLVADSIAIIVVGSTVWFYTLEERAEYQEVWLQQAVSTQIQLQDKVSSIYLLLDAYCGLLRTHTPDFHVVLVLWILPRDKYRLRWRFLQ
jgi:tetrahydromethanopterin S-methyltransferase subunit F